MIEAIRHDTDSRVLLYMLAAQAACYIASPYFNPYMLGQLKLSYVHYLILICIPYVARVVCLPAWGRVVDRIGPHRVLWLSGLLVAPLPVMWNVSDSLAALVVVQIFAGLTWAGYELAQLLLFFDTIPTERRVGVLTVYNLFNAVAIFGGSIVGGLLLAELGGGPQRLLDAVPRLDRRSRGRRGRPVSAARVGCPTAARRCCGHGPAPGRSLACVSMRPHASPASPMPCRKPHGRDDAGSPRRCDRHACPP